MFKDHLDVLIAYIEDIENNIIDDIYHLTVKNISKKVLNDYLMIEHNLDILCDIANKNNEIKSNTLFKVGSSCLIARSILF